MGLQDGKTFKPTICVEFSRASLYAFFFVAVSSWEFFLCRSSPWHPGVLNLVSFSWVSHRIGCPSPWTQNVSTLAHFMSPAAFCGQKRRFYGSKSERGFTKKLRWHRRQNSTVTTTDQDSKIFPEQKLSPKKISSQFLALLCMVGKLASEQTHCLDLQFSCEAAHALILFNLEILSRLQCINDHCNALIQITLNPSQSMFWFGCISHISILCERNSVCWWNEWKCAVIAFGAEAAIKQRPNPTAAEPKKLFWDIITHK